MKLVLPFLSLILILFMACDQITPSSTDNLADYSCEGCHTSKSTLTSVIDQLDLEPAATEQAAPG